MTIKVSMLTFNRIALRKAKILAFLSAIGLKANKRNLSDSAAYKMTRITLQFCTDYKVKLLIYILKMV